MTSAYTSYVPTVLRDLRIAMRDGIELATDVYLPAGWTEANGEKLPALLTRTPYGKAHPVAPGRPGMSDFGAYFAAHGYAVVVQDVRGRYGSDGTWAMLTDDGPDGVDTCAWIGKQPWFNGKVGMFGTSYSGGTQHAIGLEGAPELATVIPVDAVSNAGRQGMRYYGAFELRFWNWVYTGGNDVSWE